MFTWATAHFKLTTVASIFLLQAWIPLSALAWNGVAWSLSVEAFFYSLFPVLLQRLSRYGVRELLGIVLGCWLFELAIVTVYLVLRPDGPLALQDSPIPYFWKAVLKFNPAVHLPEFVAGMGCGLIFIRRELIIPRALLIGSGVAAVALVILFQQRIPYLLIHTGLLIPAFAAIIVGLALPHGKTGWLEHRFLVALGNASYSLYLLHFSVIIFLFLIKRVPFNFYTGTAYVCGIVMTSLLVFRFIEEPARHWLYPRRSVKQEAFSRCSPL
ncbi:MAG: hypothetical protein NVS1B11_32130 [Terriglobales bacterium]